MFNTLKDRLITWVTQYPVPHHFCSKGMHALTRCRIKPLKNFLIKKAIKILKIDMSIAEHADLDAYENFNAFFTRTLKAGARPFPEKPNELGCPVDGAISQIGKIAGGKIFQAKKFDFDLTTLLGGCETRADSFKDGLFATIYLSPRDYHRIHMPIKGELLEMVHIPGRLFSVSPRTTENIPGLFARNERVVALFATEHGPMAMVLVGAIFVGSIDTVWAGNIAPRKGHLVRVWDYRNQHKNVKPIILEKGEEMGRFNMGSTVILLFGQDAITWHEGVKAGDSIKMGQLLAST